MRGAWVGVAAVVVVCLLGGCGKKTRGRALVTATGAVTLKGKPLENARVAFHLADANAEFSYGVTDAEGKFKMSTYGVNDGAIVGKHKVTISKIDLPRGRRSIPRRPSRAVITSRACPAMNP